MTSKEEIRRSLKSKIGFITTARALIVFVMIAALFATAQRAEAQGTPTQIIVFTDKKAYTSYAVKLSAGQNAGYPTWDSADPATFAIYVFAVVLDDDGNIMKQRTVSGWVNDGGVFIHVPGGRNPDGTIINAADLNTHSVLNKTKDILTNRTLTFVDDGSLSGDIANDGVYTAVYIPAPFSQGTANTYYIKGETGQEFPAEDHVLVNVSVTDTVSGKNSETIALISGINCMNGIQRNSHHSTHAKDTTQIEDCAICHR
jgi:hypothetical protein